MCNNNGVGTIWRINPFQWNWYASRFFRLVFPQQPMFISSKGFMGGSASHQVRFKSCAKAFENNYFRYTDHLLSVRRITTHCTRLRQVCRAAFAGWKHCFHAFFHIFLVLCRKTKRKNFQGDYVQLFDRHGHGRQASGGYQQRQNDAQSPVRYFTVAVIIKWNP